MTSNFSELAIVNADNNDARPNRDDGRGRDARGRDDDHIRRRARVRVNASANGGDATRRGTDPQKFASFPDQAAFLHRSANRHPALPAEWADPRRAP